MLNNSGAWHVIDLAQMPAKPWKNGGGQTRELIVWPNANWLWRVSVAEVTSNAAFSHFPGVQRWLAVVTGAGLQVQVAEQRFDLLPESEPIEFSGDLASGADLLNGPVCDFNVMTQQPYRANVKRVRFTSEIANDANVAAIGVFAILQTNLFSAGKRLRVAPQQLAWQENPGPLAVHVETEHALILQILK